MRVFYLINGLGTGGAERSMAEMIPGLGKGGISIQLVCRCRREEGVQESIANRGNPIHFLKARTFAGQVRELRSLLKKQRPDLVHTTIYESDILGRLASRGLGIPVLTSLVNTSYEPVRLTDPRVSRWKLEAARKLDAWTARHMTDHFHAISKSVREASVRALGIPEERVTVIERGRDPVRLGRASAARRDATRSALALETDAEVIVTVGRQEFQKGQEHLLRAAARLLEKRPGLTILIAGREGNATRSLRELHTRLGFRDRVRFLGHHSDVPDLLCAADLFAFPSLYEGLGGAVIEAMALELPIVASRIPALEEVLEDGGNAVLVPPSDALALAHGIEQILDSPERARSFATRGREIFEHRFTLNRSASRMAQLYRGMIENSAAIPRLEEALV